MEQTYNSYFWDWLRNIYMPNLIVYSSKQLENLLWDEYFLTPAEFVRPFFDFSESDKSINFSFGDKFSINLRNLKFDTYDYNRFYKKTYQETYDVLTEVLKVNEPKFNIVKKDKNTILSEIFSLRNKESIKKSMKNYNFSWYSEFEKTFIESQFFNEYEMLQQHLGYVFILMINDSMDEILNTKNMPVLLVENVYENKMSSLIIIIHDKSKSSLSKEDVKDKLHQFEKKFPKYLIAVIDINEGNEDDSDKKDLWSPTIHKFDYYQPTYSKFRKIFRGENFGLTERKKLKNVTYKFINEYVKPYLQKLCHELDEEISNSKKGFKNNIMSIFKKSEKIEYIQNLAIYKFTPLEKKMYLLAIIQFYFRDFDSAADNLKLLSSDIKVSYLYYRINQ